MGCCTCVEIIDLIHITSLSIKWIPLVVGVDGFVLSPCDLVIVIQPEIIQVIVVSILKFELLTRHPLVSRPRWASSHC